MLSRQRTLSLRLSEEMHEASRELAQRRGVSLNALMQDALAALLRADAEQEFYDSFTLLGEDLEQCDTEYAVAAQSEVMLRDIV